MRHGVKTRTFPPFVSPGWGKIFTGLEIKKFLACIIFITCFLIGLLLYLWPHMQLLQNGFQYSRLSTYRERLSEENRALRLELSSLKSLDRVERIARGELGMITPGDKQIVYVVLDESDKRK
jgi:cell division protein FtsL